MDPLFLVTRREPFLKDHVVVEITQDKDVKIDHDLFFEKICNLIEFWADEDIKDAFHRTRPPEYVLKKGECLYFIILFQKELKEVSPKNLSINFKKTRFTLRFLSMQFMTKNLKKIHYSIFGKSKKVFLYCI